MNRSILTGLSILGLAAVATVEGPAAAYSLPGIAGHAWIPSESGCFTSSWSQMKNSCNATKKLLIPMQAAHIAGTDVAVFLYGAASPKASCRAIGNNNNGDLGYVGAIMATSGPNPSYQSFSSTISTAGTLHLDCDLGPDTIVSAVHWL